jgi:MFS family permease
MGPGRHVEKEIVGLCVPSRLGHLGPLLAIIHPRGAILEIRLSSGCSEKSSKTKKAIEMTISTFVTLALGIVLLLFGRRAFWILVAVAGFIAGLTFATQFMSGQSELVILLIAIVAGGIGAVLAIMLEWLAILIAGFLAGGYLATTLAVSLGMAIASGNWVVYIIGGIIGLILVAALFDWAIIILSVLLGADLIVSVLSIPSSTYYWVIFLVLIVVGIVVQAGYWHRRYPVQRTWGRRQST